MSEGLQKVAGKKLRAAMRKLTANRFMGVLTGFGVTSIVQSSSATTVMLVSFTNAGLVTLTQAVGVIMGANIGTTVTGWLVALLGFKVKINILAMVAVAAGFGLKLLGKKSLPYWGEVLMGFGLIFVGLDFMKDAMSGLRDAPVVTNWMSQFSADSIPSLLVVVAIGTIVTMAIQSSSATMALTMALAAQGIISFPSAAALIMGENIGTTITANLAAISASRNAKRAALAHFIFNICGVIWLVFAFSPFVRLVDALVPGSPTDPIAIPGHMAMFHTVFNVVNTIIFLPQVAFIVKLVNKILPLRPDEKETLTYIDTALIATPSLALESSRQEVYKMAENTVRMLNGVMEILNSPLYPSPEKVEEIGKYEAETDRQKLVITDFLRHVLSRHTSKAEGVEVTRILSHVNDLERIADHCKGLLMHIQETYKNEIPLPLEAHQDLVAIGEKNREFLELIRQGLRSPGKNIMDQARAIEEVINHHRAKGNENHRQRLLERACDIASGLIFLEMLVQFEKIGDHAFNIAERISGVR